ncbi:HAD family hydrolase [Pseudomonas sp. Teo4]|uniref:HAD family hydrolase n=1 Tax=Pseudomonas sp. Teo4 TaxID=3064528 RepID=UPI002ABD01E7|nr:Phosphoglycolate phosphatase [Pseudomonas sp. Teo4]
MLTALLFDLDGTLTDTDTLHLQAFRQLLREHDGRELTQAQFDSQVSGRANGELFADLFPQATTAQCQALADRKEALFRELAPALEPMPGLLRLLEHAQAHGIGMCVVTNAPRLNAEHMLTAMGLGERFEHVLVAEELERAKPDPLPYLTGLRCLGLRPGRRWRSRIRCRGCRRPAGGDLHRGDRHDPDARATAGCGAQLVVDDFDDPRLWGVIERMLG